MTGIKKSITSINVIRSGRGAALLCDSRLLTNNTVDKQEPEIWDSGGAATPEGSTVSGPFKSHVDGNFGNSGRENGNLC